MSAWIALRLVKFVLLGVLAVGLGLAAGAPRQADRARAALGLATPALFASWMAGFGLLVASGRSMATPFVGLGVLAGALALGGALAAASSARPSGWVRALGPAGLGAASAIMAARELSVPMQLLAAAVGALIGGGVVSAMPHPDGEPDPLLAERVRRWFVWLARFEGLSLVTLMLIAMPLRRGLHIHLDGGTGALGWAHGTLWVLYLLGLGLAWRALGWSLSRVAAAFVASLVPFGTVVFERRALAERG